MSTQRHTPQHAIEQPEVIRALIESGAMPNEDLFNLSLCNKPLFRVVNREQDRHNVRTVPFLKSDSAVCYVIEEDRPEQLKELLALGEFHQDASSPNGRLLRANGGRGLHLLMGMCVDNGAARCLRLLMQWADDPATPFSYDREWVYNKAKAMALRNGRLDCLLMLHDSDKKNERQDYPSPDALYLTLLKQARSPAAIGWLAKRLPRDTDLLPVLIAQCSNRNTQPAVLEVVLDWIPRQKHSAPATLDGGRATTALAAAAAALHPAALDVLLRHGVPAFTPYRTSDTHARLAWPHNPLFAALSQRVPSPPLPTPTPLSGPTSPASTGTNTSPSTTTSPTTSSSSSSRIFRNPPAPQTRRFPAPVAQHASRLRATVSYLLEAARLELRARPDRVWLAPELLDHGALVWVHTLRAWLLQAVLDRIQRDAGSPGPNPMMAVVGGSAPREEGASEKGGEAAEGANNANGGEEKKRRRRRGKNKLEKRLLVEAVAGLETAWTGHCTVGRVLVDGAGPEAVGRGEAELAFTWRKGLEGPAVREMLKAVGIELHPYLEEVWMVLASPAVVDLAKIYLEVSPQPRARPGNSLDTLWDLLVAAERRTPGTSAEDDEVSLSPCSMSSSSSEGGTSVSEESAEHYSNHHELLSYLDVAVAESASDSDTPSEAMLTPTSDSSYEIVEAQTLQIVIDCESE